MTLFVIARYAPRMTEEREQRIDAALERCGLTVDGEFVVPEGGLAELPADTDYRAVDAVTEFDWSADDDDTNTQLVINMNDDADRAARLAAELRFCDMTVSIQHDDPLHDG